MREAEYKKRKKKKMKMDQEIDDVNKTAILRLVKKMFLGAIKMRF